MTHALPYIFVDLDETLVHSAAKEACEGLKLPEFDSFAHGPYVTFLRPEALEILAACREQAREVVLFTFSERAYAAEISQAFGLGFAANQVFGCELFLFGEKDMAPAGALIDDKPPGHDNAQLKMRTLGIGSDRYLQIPSFHPPKFAPCRMFLLGLPYRLEKLTFGLRRRTGRCTTAVSSGATSARQTVCRETGVFPGCLRSRTLISGTESLGVSPWIQHVSLSFRSSAGLSDCLTAPLSDCLAPRTPQ